MAVRQLNTGEAVVIDLDRFAALQGTGADWGTIDDVVAALCEVERAWADARHHDLPALADRIVATADRFGMSTFARTARDLGHLATRQDCVALAAVLSRLIRVGEASLAAVWDMQDLRL